MRLIIAITFGLVAGCLLLCGFDVNFMMEID
jgi:hypothetical protein